MLILTTVDEINRFISSCRNLSKTIGFVPTMGALHQGHLELVKKSIKENNITVCSVFVNPTQFNDKSDLEKYPRTLDKDCTLLRTIKTDVVFAPTVAEIYPSNIEVVVPELGGLDLVMEGEFRPGHFEGMAQVVKRLLDIVKPDRLYMGQKDFQQFTIVQYMLKKLQSEVKLVILKTIRENNGLAMSSRNQRLSEEMKNKAGLIYRTLTTVKKQTGKKTPEMIAEYAKKRLSKAGFEVEYFAIVDGNSLKIVHDFNKHSYVVACVALWAEGVRLIDNMILKNVKKFD
ncbi:MAG: pantoate--beta-alanine ligase [Saprospiraceae bacterium]|nr:pantoate--beta-alanine ligase [Saprospiraceae bacterium]MBK6783046.1 pantoate--beta-alanine ligase [Saprospiraceae bacterium]MBK7523541.1 pantoate--beta-alanine ligase [Saprospiraceae bacterium]MBK8079652.1 pantoate--beta-alanine ligase [Saprospiraceae bacterium]MBK8371474.1 pantoate--beta-alanine ligase [Saprospiraceae bacterium]